MTHAHFAYGWINPVMGFGFAMAGSFLGLTCMIKARQLPKGRSRTKWLAFAALAIGVTGIWMMHFIAMIGFSVIGSNVRYDVPITTASLAISVVSVSFGLFVVGMGDPSRVKVAIGGPLTGLGVVVMHYTGMAAVNISGTITYDTTWMALSVVIAIVAATAALSFATWVRGRVALLLSSLIMAVAVCGMHYTGMMAVSVTVDTNSHTPVPGADPLLLLIPILILATVVLIGLIFGLIGGQDEFELPSRFTDLPDTARPTAPVTPSDTEVPALWADDTPPAPAVGAERRRETAAALSQAGNHRRSHRTGLAPAPDVTTPHREPVRHPR